jgi:Flp pilus assembly protein TadB
MLAKFSSTGYANTEKGRIDMAEIDLFTWWALSISFSSIFLTLISVYLYRDSISRREKSIQKKSSIFRIGKDFVFVFVLLGLLIFYIFSVQLGAGVMSEAVFVAGNIVVEVLLVVYLIRNKTEKSEQNRQ